MIEKKKKIQQHENSIKIFSPLAAGQFYNFDIMKSILNSVICYFLSFELCEGIKVNSHQTRYLVLSSHLAIL